VVAWKYRHEHVVCHNASRGDDDVQLLLRPSDHLLERRQQRVPVAGVGSEIAHGTASILQVFYSGIASFRIATTDSHFGAVFSKCGSNTQTKTSRCILDNGSLAFEY